CMENLEFPYSF
nr:immunoglobulin light chain junction region [Macaca mulatta]